MEKTMNNERKTNRKDDPRERYFYDAKFKAIVDFMFSLIVNEQITPFELSQALILALMKYEEMVLRPMFKIPSGVNNNADKK